MARIVKDRRCVGNQQRSVADRSAQVLHQVTEVIPLSDKSLYVFPAYRRSYLSFTMVRSSSVEHHIAFDANLFDQIKLALEEVDMFLLAVQDLLQ